MTHKEIHFQQQWIEELVNFEPVNFFEDIQKDYEKLLISGMEQQFLPYISACKKTFDLVVRGMASSSW